MIDKAFNLLSSGDFNMASLLFSQILQEVPESIETQMGIVLCDMAKDDFTKAIGLLDFYFALLSEEDSSVASKKILDLINSMDQQENAEFTSIISSIQNDSESLSCISFNDFKNFVLQRPDFKEAFEDFALSTKIVFSHKEEIYEFLNLLIDQGCANLSMQYAENIGENMGFDPGLNKILQKAAKHLK